MMKSLEMRGRILDAARNLFAKQGVGKTTLEDIGRLMHRTKSFIYHYFPGKDELLRAFIEMEGDAYKAKLRDAVDGEKTAKKRLRAYILARFRIFRGFGNFYQAMRERYYEQYAFIQKVREKYDRFETEVLTGILDQGVREGKFRTLDVRAVAHAIQTAVKGFEIEWTTAKAQQFERGLDDLLGILFEGVSRH